MWLNQARPPLGAALENLLASARVLLGHLSLHGHVSHLARTSAGAFTEGLPASSSRALGFCWAAVLATLPEGATVEGVEALSPISLHISSAACVRLAQYVIVRSTQKS